MATINTYGTVGDVNIVFTSYCLHHRRLFSEKLYTKRSSLQAFYCEMLMKLSPLLCSGFGGGHGVQC